jgi:YhcN/YlaJ family sporulation lipoprotein
MKRWVLTFTCAIGAALMLSACMNNDENNNKASEIGTNMKQNVQQSVRPLAPQQRTYNLRQITNQLEKVAKSIPEVKQANAILIGKTAIVGIDLAKQTDRAKADSIKYAVARALRKEPYGARAIVTSDADMGQRIMNVRNGIVNGQPLASFTNELGEIIGRIAPQMSNQVAPQPIPKKLPYQAK